MEERPQLPWSLADARTTFFTAVGGLGTVLIGWWGASGTGRASHQTGWMAAAVVGVLILGMGNALWLLAGRRAVGSRRAQLLDRLEAVPAEAEVDASSDATLVAVPGTARRHRATCPLVRGKRTVAGGEDLRPCEMCLAGS